MNFYRQPAGSTVFCLIVWSLLETRPSDRAANAGSGMGENSECCPRSSPFFWRINGNFSLL